eukprot:2431658-Amphidinium_carterae.2
MAIEFTKDTRVAPVYRALCRYIAQQGRTDVLLDCPVHLSATRSTTKAQAQNDRSEILATKLQGGQRRSEMFDTIFISMSTTGV